MKVFSFSWPQRKYTLYKLEHFEIQYVNAMHVADNKIIGHSLEPREDLIYDIIKPFSKEDSFRIACGCTEETPRVS